MHKDDHWAFTIKRIHETVRKHTNSRLSRYNLTVSQIRVLMNLYDTPTKQMSMKELEKAIDVAQSTTVGTVARLEQKGFVERFGSAEDKRVKYVRITSKGIEYCAESEQCMYESENMLLEKLTEEERSVFCQLLEKINRAIE